jgi:hypothetical protein
MEREGKQRVAMNEAAFRKVNEGIKSGKESSGLLNFVWECGRPHCTGPRLLVCAPRVL